jgi:hypothetical protein
VQYKSAPAGYNLCGKYLLYEVGCLLYLMILSDFWEVLFPLTQVMLVSAQEALLARLVLQDKASDEDRAKFAHKVWGKSFVRSRRSKSEKEYMEQAAVMLQV